MSKILRLITLLALILSSSACSYIKATKVLSPQSFGMEKIAATVYVDTAMNDTMRAALLENHRLAKTDITHIYGSVRTNPDVIACSTESCFQVFGGQSARAMSFADRAFLLSPRGLSSHIISHEWSHNELYARIDSFWTMRSIPQWFDEGLAVVSSNEPSHGPQAWQEITRLNIPTPALDELTSLQDWYDAIDKYGEHKKSPENPESLKVVYATAGHEIRQWYDDVGQTGLLALIKAVKSGEEFAPAYQDIKASAHFEQAGNH